MASAAAALRENVIGRVVPARWVPEQWREGDESAFILALAGAILLSPIVWGHYLILLLIPIALARPRLSPVWFTLLLFNIPLSTAHNQGSTWRIVFVLVLSIAILVRTSVRLRERRRLTGEPSIPLQPA